MELTAHELLVCQEHVREEAATVHQCRAMAQQCRDPDLRRFVENEARAAEQSVQRLMQLLPAGHAPQAHY